IRQVSKRQSAKDKSATGKPAIIGEAAVAAARDQVARVIRDGDADEQALGSAAPRAEGAARPTDEARPKGPDLPPGDRPAPQEPKQEPRAAPPAAAASAPAAAKSNGRRRKILIGVA